MTETAVNEPSQRRARERLSRRIGLIAAYLLAAAAGYAIGIADWGSFRSAPVSSPLARVGYALRAENPQATAEEWALLRQDLSAVRAHWKPEERDVFDLVVAIRGLEGQGQPNYQEAERLCRALRWPRCDRAALDALRQRSRP